jgi:hypothetical protein
MLTRNDTTERQIIYSKEDHDYTALLGGQYVGSYATYHEAEVELDRLALELLTYAQAS